MTVGIVIVSHSARLAAGVVELAREMAGVEVALEAAGGLDEPGDPIGTDAVRVMGAIERVTAGGGEALVLMDLGSAVLSAETALDLLDDDIRARTLLCEAPLVEGAVAAAAAARAGASLIEAAREARAGLAGKQAHLGVPAAQASPVEPDTGGDWAAVELTVTEPHGLHARPAAAVVRAVADHDAEARIRNLTTGAGPVTARSLTSLSTLGVLEGHRIRIEARGHDAAEVLAAAGAVIEATDDVPAQASVAPSTTAAPAPGDVLQGVSASTGSGLGLCFRTGVTLAQIPTQASGSPAFEREALTDARARAADELETLGAAAGAQTADIVRAQLLVLTDPILAESANAAIAIGVSAAKAWSDVIDAAAAAYARLDDPYQRARGADVLEVGRRVVALVLGGDADRESPSGVVVADELGAAEVAALDTGRVVAIATAAGGATGHAAIIARSRGIPAVMGLGATLLAISEATPLLVDADAGRVIVAPSPDAIADHECRVREAREHAANAAEHAHEPAFTRDGRIVPVEANIGAPGDLAAALAGGADGVGLLRSEFLFLGRATAPDEDAQHAAYADAVAQLTGRRLVVRTLDAGADKPLAYLDMPLEDNPFLGVRGIRLCLARPEILTTQLRAVLRAAEKGPVSVMFPMVSDVSELLATRTLLEDARASLQTDGIAHGDVEVGVMIEVPAAALCADALARHVDFFSIGTNDLVQYVMAAERGNAGVAALSDPLHPAVLQLIASVTAAAARHDCRVAVCGETASDPVAVPILLGLGVDELSVTPRRIALVKQAVRAVAMPQAMKLAADALSIADAPSVRELSRTVLRDVT